MSALAPYPFEPISLTAEGYRNVALLFRTADDALDFIIGPTQRDAHVETYRGHLWLKRKQEQHARANEAVATEVNKIIAEWRAAREPAHA